MTNIILDFISSLINNLQIWINSWTSYTFYFSHNANFIFENLLILYDSLISYYITFCHQSILYHCFLVGFEDYDSILNSYLSHNINIYSYPIMLELYAEQLNFGFKFLKLFYRQWYFEYNLTETARSNASFFSYLFYETTSYDDYFTYNLYLRAYYNYIFDLPLNYTQFFYNNNIENFGLDFELKISSFSFKDKYYTPFRGEGSKLFPEIYPSIYSNFSPISTIYESVSVNDVVFQNIKNLTSDFTLNIIRDDRLNLYGKPFRTGEKFGYYSDYVVTVWEYINTCCENSEYFTPIRWWQLKRPWWDRPWWLYGPYEWWPELLTRRYLMDYFKYEHYVFDLTSEENLNSPFDFGENDIHARVLEYHPLSFTHVLWGQPNRDFWVSFLFDTYSGYSWAFLVMNKLNTGTTEPHVEYINLYNFIHSQIDNTSIQIYSEYYTDLFNGRPMGKLDFYTMIKEMREQRLLQKLPIKTDHLVFFIDMYEKSEKFYKLYLDLRLYWHRLLNWQNTLYYMYIYYFAEVFATMHSVLFYKVIYYQKTYWEIDWIVHDINYWRTLFINWFDNYLIITILFFFVSSLFLLIYIFSAFIKSSLPHNIIYNVQSKKIKRLKNKKKLFYFFKKKINYSELNKEDLDYYNKYIIELFSKINNLEGWIFNLDSNDFYSKSKLLRFFRLDKKSKSLYINQLKKNGNLMYKTFFTFDSLKHYENSTKVFYTPKAFFLLGRRSKWKTLRFFLTWILNGFTNVYFNLSEKGHSLDKKHNVILPWPKFFTKLLYTYLILPFFMMCLLLGWYYFKRIFKFFWRLNFIGILAPKLFSKGSFNEQNLHKTYKEIQKLLMNIDVSIEDINKELTTLHVSSFKTKNKYVLNHQRVNTEFALYNTERSPGSRVYYLFSTIARFFFIWINSLKLINVSIDIWSFRLSNNIFLKKIKEFIYFLYWEYMLFRNNYKVFRNFGYSFIFFCEFCLGILLPLFFFLVPLLLFYFIWKLIKYYFYYSKKFIYNSFATFSLQVDNFKKVYKNKQWYRYLEIISYYIILFWRFIYIDPLTNQGLILRLYVNYVHKGIIYMYRFFQMSKGAFLVGLKKSKSRSKKDGFIYVLRYWCLKFLVFCQKCFFYMFRFIRNFFLIKLKLKFLLDLIKQILKNFYYNYNLYKTLGFQSFILKKISMLDFILYNIFSLEFDLYLGFFIKKFLIKFFNLVKYVFQVLIFTVIYIFCNFDLIFLHILITFWKTSYKKKFDRLYKYLGLEFYYFKNVIFRNRLIYWMAFKTYFKKDWKKALKYLWLNLLSYTPYGWYYIHDFWKYDSLTKNLYDGRGYITALNDSFFTFNFFKQWSIEIHIFFYYGGLSRFIAAEKWYERQEELVEKRNAIVWTDRQTWLSNFEVIELMFLTYIYLYYLAIIAQKYEEHIQIFEKTYRHLDQNILTRHWSLLKRFRFLYWEFKRVNCRNANLKLIEKKKDILGYKLLKLEKKAKRIFFFKALFNFISIFFFRGKFIFKKIDKFKYKFNVYDINQYLDFNLKNLTPYFWFLAIMYRFVYNKIFKFFYSGEYLGDKLNIRDKEKAFLRLNSPGAIKADDIAPAVFKWVYNSGRFMIELIYTPISNWPLRMTGTLISFAAKRSRLKSDLKKYWVFQKLENLIVDKSEKALLTDNEKSWEEIKERFKKNFNKHIENYLTDEKSTLLKLFIKLGEDLETLNPDQRSALRYQEAKAKFQKIIDQGLGEDKFLEFIAYTKEDYEKVALYRGHKFYTFIKKFKITFLDILEYSFTDFIEAHYDDSHPLRSRFLSAGLRLKADIETKKLVLLEELDKLKEQIQEAKENIKTLSELEQLSKIDFAEIEENYEKMFKTYKEEKEDHYGIKMMKTFKYKSLAQSYYDIDEQFDPWDIVEAFKLANRFYHWTNFVTIVRLYLEWNEALKEESKVNNEINELNMIKKIWDLILNNPLENILSDGSATINAYYSNAWVYVHHYEEWAKDDEFDFTTQMHTQYQSVFLHNNFVVTVGREYFNYREKVEEYEAWDFITHSPLHYNRTFRKYKRGGWINRWLSHLSIVVFFYVLFFLPGEYIVNYHLLTIPLSTWFVSSVMYYFYYKPFVKIMQAGSIFSYKWDWRKHNPFLGNVDLTDDYIKGYTDTFTQNRFYFWKNIFWGITFWNMAFWWYFCEWYETDAWRHRWFPWDATQEHGVYITMQDIIHDDGLARLCAGKNYFSLPYANTYRARAGIHRLPLDGPYNIDNIGWDLKAGAHIELLLNYFIEKCTFYIRRFICSDDMRHKYPDYDITKAHLTHKEHIEFMKYKLNEYVGNKNIEKTILVQQKIEEKSVSINKTEQNEKLLNGEEDSLFLYVDVDKFKLWYNDFFMNLYISLNKNLGIIDKKIKMWEKDGFSEYFSKDILERMDIWDKNYYNFSVYIKNQVLMYIQYISEYIDLIIEFIKNFF